MIATDEQGCPRWVVCRWEASPCDASEPEPEKVLLLAVHHPRNDLAEWATVYLPSERALRIVTTKRLCEMTPE